MPRLADVIQAVVGTVVDISSGVAVLVATIGVPKAAGAGASRMRAMGGVAAVVMMAVAAARGGRHGGSAVVARWLWGSHSSPRRFAWSARP